MFRLNRNAVLGAYALLAVALVSVSLALSTLNALDNPRIAGTPPGYHYYALGIERDGRPDFRIDTNLIDRLTSELPQSMAVATVEAHRFAFAPPSQPGNSKSAVVELVTGSYFRALHLHPAAGRLLTAADLQANAAVTVLGAKLASQLFGSWRDAVGRSVLIGAGTSDAISARIIGIVPTQFSGISQSNAEAWLPLQAMFRLSGLRPSPNGKPANIGGLPGILSAPLNMSQREVQSTLEQAWQRLPTSVRGYGTRGPVLSTPFSIDPSTQALIVQRTKLYLAIAIVALVLSAVNVFMLRWLELVRRRDVLQLELVLGATRSRLVRDYVSRTLLIVLTLFAMTSVLAFGSYAALYRMFFGGATWKLLFGGHVFQELTWVLPVLVIVAALSESLSIRFMLPHDNLTEIRNMTMRPGDRSLGIAVLTAEVFLAAAMSFVAAWALSFAWQQRHADLGMMRAPISVLSIQRKSTQSMAFAVDLDRVAQANSLLLDHLQQAVTRVQPNSHVATGPALDFTAKSGYSMNGPQISYLARKSVTTAQPLAASVDWLYVADARLVAGQNFDDNNPNPSGVLIDANVAHALFGDARAALGRSVTAVRGESHQERLHVLGVIAPLLLSGPNHPALPVVIGDLRADPYSPFTILGGPLLIRPAIPAARYHALRAAIDTVLEQQAPQLELQSIRSSERILEGLTAPQVRQAQVFLAIALFAWTIVLFGVTAHLRLHLAMRKRLAAIRSALGAGPHRLYGEVLGGVLLLAIVGMALALFAAPWLAQQFALLSGAQVAPFGPATWIALAVLLLAVFLVAHFPARRAARAEPAESLHEL